MTSPTTSPAPSARPMAPRHFGVRVVGAIAALAAAVSVFVTAMEVGG